MAKMVVYPPICLYNHPELDRIWNWTIPEIVLNLPTPGCIHTESDRKSRLKFLGRGSK